MDGAGIPYSTAIAITTAPEREFFIDNLLVRIHFIIVIIRWTGLARDPVLDCHRDHHCRDWYVIAEQPAPAPHLAHSEECAALRIVLVTVPRVSRSCENFPDGIDLHLLHPSG